MVRHESSRGLSAGLRYAKGLVFHNCRLVLADGGAASPAARPTGLKRALGEAQPVVSRPGPICASGLGGAVAGDRAFMRLQQYPSGKFMSAQPDPRRGGRAGGVESRSDKGMTPQRLATDP